MLNQRTEISKILRFELGRRIKANPRYSLRAFARSLNCDPSLLSKIMNEKRDGSPTFVLRLSQCSEETRKRVEELLRNQQTKDDQNQRSLPKADYSQIRLDVFELISDPIHYKILEITKLKNFRPDPKWIAKSLLCSVHRVREVTGRLQDLGLLSIDSDGKWIDTTGDTATHIIGTNVTTLAHRSHQKKILEDAITALEQTPIEKRDQSSMMMATSLGRIKQAKILITQFRRELRQFLEEADDKDTLLQLSISLFPSSFEVNDQKLKNRTEKQKDVSNEI